MTKLIKLSLAAAMVATAVNAADFSTSGKLYIEGIHDDIGTQKFDLDADVTFTAKASDNLTFKAELQADGEVAPSTDTTNEQNKQEDVTLQNLTATYTQGAASLTTGRFAVNTPTTDGEYGMGYLSTVKAGPVSLVAGYVSDWSKTDDDASVIAGFANVGGVNLEAWQVNPNGNSENTTYVASTTVAGVTVAARVANTDFDNGTEGETTKVSISGKVAGAKVTGIYLENDEDGAAYVTDASSANTIEMMTLNAANAADTTVKALIVSAPVAGMTATIGHTAADFAGDDASLTMVKLGKKINAQTSASVTYGVSSSDYSEYDERDEVRFDVKYTF